MTDLLVERHDAHATLTLNRPEKRNALSVALRDAISDALDALAVDEQMKCVVITGAGSVFSAGFDLSEFTRAADDDAFGRELWASSDRYHDTVLRFPLPDRRRAQRAALAGGFDLAILCDLRIASTTVRFAHPERTFGDVVYGPLHDLVGGAIARELTIGGRELERATKRSRCTSSARSSSPTRSTPRPTRPSRECAPHPASVLVRTKAKALRRAGFGAAAPTLDL